MGKRRFLKTLSAIGVSGAALAHMSKETLAETTDEPEKQIPRLKRIRHTNHEAVVTGEEAPETEPEFYTIPREVHIRNQCTNAVEQAMNARFKDDEQVSARVIHDAPESDTGRSVRLEVQTIIDRDGERATPSLTVPEVKNRVPDQAQGKINLKGKTHTRSGIPIEVKEVTLEETAYFNNDYKPNVPAGCQIETAAFGTMCTPVYDYDRGESVWVTAGHVVQGETDTNVSHPTFDPYGYNNNLIGESDKVLPNGDGDIATIAPLDSNYPSYTFADIGGGTTSYDVYGTLGQDMINDNNINNLYLQGRTSGRLYGDILSYNTTDHQVRLDIDAEKGDSGGPYYWVDNGEAYIAGVHAVIADYEDGDGDIESAGSTMQWTNDTFNLTI